MPYLELCWLPGDGIFLPACLDDNACNLEELLLLTQGFTEGSVFHPKPLVDSRDSYPQTFQDAVTSFTDKTDVQLEMKESGLGSELLSQTDSESAVSDLEEDIADLDSETKHLGENKIAATQLEIEVKNERSVISHIDCYDSIPYIDNGVIIRPVNVGDGLLVRVSGERGCVYNEDDLIEFENVNVHPDFDKASSCNFNIDQNNQNNKNEIQFRSQMQDLLADKNQNESLDISQDLKCILDDLDTHLNQSFDSSSENPDKIHLKLSDSFPSEYPDISDDSRSSQAGPVDIKTFTLVNKQPLAYPSKTVHYNGSALGSFSKINDQRDLIGEHKTPPFKGVFSHAVDSIYVTKKRSLPSTDNPENKIPESTPLRPFSYDQFYPKETGVTGDKTKNSAVRKSVWFSAGNEKADVNKTERSLPKQGISALSNASTKTYFASLEKSGNLSPFIKSIADKYGLFGSSVSPNNEPQEESFDATDVELDESYASTLLGKSGEFDDSIFGTDLHKSPFAVCPVVAEVHADNKTRNLEGTEGTVDTDKVDIMINNYLYDVLGCLSDKSQDSAENDLNNYVDQYVDKIVFDCFSTIKAENRTTDDMNNRSNRDSMSDTEANHFESSVQDHDSDLSDLEFYSDSVLLCITQGSDDSPPLSCCSPSLYPSYSDHLLPETCASPPKRSESAVVTQRENECHWFSRKQVQTQVNGNSMFRPVETPQMYYKFHMNDSPDDDESILGRMMITSSPVSKLPDSGNIRQTSSYCRIPFGSSPAPSFWFKKDFRESPKPRKTSRHRIEWKAKSPGKRSFTALHNSLSAEKLYQVPSLVQLAEKVHLSLFRKRLDAIIRKHSIETSGDTITLGCVERSPAKKRRRKQELENVHYHRNTSNSASRSAVEGSVEIYFTNLLDHAGGEDFLPAAPVSSEDFQAPFKEKIFNNTPTVDWSRTLFGSKSGDGCVQNDAECIECLVDDYDEEVSSFIKKDVISEKVSNDSPFVSPFKSDRHFRHRPVQCLRSNSFLDECSEKRRRRKFRSKVGGSRSEEPVTLTGYRKLSSIKGHSDPASVAVKVFNENRANFGLEKAPLHANRNLQSSDLHNTGTFDDFKGRSECSIDSDTNFSKDFGCQDISTQTNYSEDDLCGISDFSESMSFSEEKLKEISCHDTALAEAYPCVTDSRQSQTSIDIEDDNTYPLSMFHRNDSNELDENTAEISLSESFKSDQLNLAKRQGELCTDCEKDATAVNKSSVIEDSYNSAGHSEKLVTKLTDVERNIDDLKDAVKSLCDTSKDSEANVVNMMKTRETMYEAISRVVESCSDALEGNDFVDTHVENKSTAMCDIAVDYDDNDENDPKNDWDISPDPDTLLRDLQDINLSDTPQYVSSKNTDHEIKEFLDTVLQPFDDIFTDSFSSVGESPIHRTSTKDTELNDDVHTLCDSAANDALSTEPESVLNRSFMEDEQIVSSSDETLIRFELQNASSTPIYEQCSPTQVPELLGTSRPGEVMKSPDTEDESFVTATSSRTYQYEYSKSAVNSFESYQTGIDRSSFLGWSEEDTIHANSDLENFSQLLPECSVERTCVDQDESPEIMIAPFEQDWQLRSNFTAGKSIRKAAVANGAQGDSIVDPRSVHLDIQAEAGKWQEQIGENRGFTEDFLSYHLPSNEIATNLSRNKHSENLIEVEPYLDGSDVDQVVSQFSTSPFEPACFYVGSSHESGESDSEFHV